MRRSILGSRVPVIMYKEYYLNQIGNGVFMGGANQRGHGLGHIFSGLFRAALPLLKSAAKTVGKQAMRSGIDAVRDVSQGRSWREAFENRAGEGLGILTDKAIRQAGGGRGGRGGRGGYIRKRTSPGIKNKLATKRVKLMNFSEAF